MTAPGLPAKFLPVVRFVAIIASILAYAGLPVWPAAVPIGQSASADAAGIAETAWHDAPHSRVRLLAGGLAADATDQALLAGVHIRLDPGWKTYWRVPGDSGVPPVFDWSASTNLASARVLWPVPQRYADKYGTTIGYLGEVVFPILVTPLEPGSPVTANLALSYAVCKEICLPNEARLSITLSPDADAAQSLIAVWRATTPVEGNSETSGITSVTVEGSGADTTLVVEIEPSAPGVVPKLFVEGPDAFWFGDPKTVAAASDSVRLAIPVSGVSKERPLAGQLTLTVVNGERRVQQEVSIN